MPEKLVTYLFDMNDKGNIIDQRPPFLPMLIGTGCGSGFWPWGPGTAGSVLATIIWGFLGLWLPTSTLSVVTLSLLARGQQNACSRSGVKTLREWW